MEGVSFSATTDKRKGIRLDPRTKLILLLTVTTLMFSTSNEGIMNFVKPVLSLIPFVLILSERRFKTAGKYLLLYLACFALERITPTGRMPLHTDGTRFYAYTAVASGRVIWQGGERQYKAGDSFLIPAALGDYALEGGVLYKSYYPNVEKSEEELKALGVDLDKVGGKR